MAQKSRHWFWNVLIVLTLLVCTLAFAAHYKNWVSIGDGHVKILSGIYYQKLDYATLDEVEMVNTIPLMERIHGFSVREREKGVFRDSLTGAKVYLYIDKLSDPKIRLVHHDSLQLFLNFTDSLKTKEMFRLLSLKIEENHRNKKD